MSNSKIQQQSSSFLRKLLSTLIAAISIIALILLVGNGGNIPWLPSALVFSVIAFILPVALIAPFVWHHREMKGWPGRNKIYRIFYDIIRFCIAANLILFGLKKFFGLQFIVPEDIARMPMNEQSGEWLTWYYFGYSTVFGCIIAIIQIGGSILLMFRKTVLLGTFILFALMVNLCLINIFYRMNTGALIQSLITTIGLMYLLSLENKKIRSFFFQQSDSILYPTSSDHLKTILLCIMILVISIIYTFYLTLL